MTIIWLVAGWCAVSVMLAFGVGRALHVVTGDHFVQYDPHAEPVLSGPGPCPAGPTGWRDAAGDVHRMLSALEQHEPRLAKTVLLCWIGGLSPRAAAETLGVPATLAAHDLQVAKLLLRTQAPADPRG